MRGGLDFALLVQKHRLLKKRLGFCVCVGHHVQKQALGKLGLVPEPRDWMGYQSGYYLP